MHGECLGVVNKMIDFWYNPKNHGKQFYISAQQKRIINQRIATIKPCRFIGRRLGPLENFKQFKASQYRSFLLYFYPVLDGILDQQYYNHFRLLSASIYVLLKPKISKNELLTAKIIYGNS